MRGAPVAAVDVSATRGRVVLGRLAEGRIAFSTVHSFGVNYSLLAGHCYWEFGAIYREILTGLRHAREASPDLAGCGIDFWGCDHVLLGSDGRLLQPAYSYRDARTARVMQSLSAEDREKLYGWTGIPPVPYNSTFQLAESLSTMPCLADRAERCLFLAEYVNRLLTGKAVNEVSVASSGQLLPLRGDGLSQETLAFFKIPGRWFSGPARAGQPLGTVAGIAGLDGLQVTLVPAHDTSCAFEAMPSFGRSPLLVTGVTWLLVGIRSRLPYAAADGCYLEISNERCGDGTYRPTRILLGLWMVHRLLESFGYPSPTMVDWQELGSAIRAVPKSRHVLSTFDARLMSPENMRQAIDDCMRSRKCDVPRTLPEYLRLLVDSISHSVASSARIFRHVVEVPFDHIVVAGAAARHPLICQGIADATGKRVVACPAVDAAAGNIGYQWMAHGELDDLDSFREALGRSITRRDFDPTPGTRPDYEI